MADQYCNLSWPVDGVAMITLNRPEKLNAINVEMLQQWRHILETLEKPTAPKCLLITGEGRAFSSGADIKATVEVARDHNGDLGSILSAYYNPVILMLNSLPYPVITVVNGLAVGVGFSFALHGDIILAADDAYFWANFSEIGLATDGGMSHVLPRSIGYHKALAYTLLAKKISSSEAKHLGIVFETYASSQLMQEALKLAKGLAARSAVANREIKRLVKASSESTFEDQLHAESIAQAKAGYSDAAKQAIMQFLVKKDQG